MTIDAIVCWFHNPAIQTPHHKSLEEVFFRQYEKWKQYIDHVTMIDSNWGLSHWNDHITHRLGSSHWASLEYASRKSSADVLFFVDQDMLIYDPSLIERMREHVEKGNICSILDGSGQQQWFPGNFSRNSRSRLCPYLCMINNGLVREGEYAFDPDSNHDTMGVLTEKLFLKGLTDHLYEIPDNRFSVYLHGKDITWNTNLDGSGYAWSDPLDREHETGCYHIRNATLGLELCEEYFCNYESYERRKNMSPPFEMLRSLSWWWIMDEIAGNYSGLQRILTVVNDIGCTTQIWNRYIETMKEQHQWIKKL